jgi:diguanylate cyclase (GGDEF)-like protein
MLMSLFTENAPTPTLLADSGFPDKSIGTNKGAFLIGAGAIVVGLYLSSLYHYLLFHSLVEIYCATIAFSTFMVAWNSRKYENNLYLNVLGIAYLQIGFLDILHTLSYDGMHIFTDYGYYANQVWIATRYLQAVSLTGGLWVMGKKKRPDPYFLLSIYLLVTAAIVASIFILKIFPVCFVEGKGQTLFKQGSEVIVCVLLGVGLFLLHRRNRSFSPRVYRQIQGAMIATIASETAFIFYNHSYGLPNLIGHYFKLLSFYLVYRAIIQTGILNPYGHVFQELKAKERELQKLALMDELTGLYNRRAAFMFLRKTLSRAERSEKPCTVCYLDVDALKTINDRFGHKEGDRVIRGMGQAITTGIREMDYGCRIGGDEFLLVFPECRDLQVLPIVERIRDNFHVSLKDRLWEFPVDFSYGLSEYKGYGIPDVDRIVETADNRMYENKVKVKKKVRLVE